MGVWTSWSPRERGSEGGVSTVVTSTANAIAALRACESERAEGRLFVDPWARALAGEAATRRHDGGSKDRDKGRIAIRTRFFDDFVEASLAAFDAGDGDGTKTRQVVFLGAGYDTRSWRCEAPNERARSMTRIFEVDAMSVLARKLEIVGAETPLTLGSERREVRCDMEREDWFAALQAAGFERDRPTVWILEGLLYYLSPRVAKAMLERCRSASAPGSTLGVSVVNRAALRRATREPLRRKLARFLGFEKSQKSARAMWRSAIDDLPERYFAPWRVDVCAQLGESPLHFGRWTGDAPDQPPTTTREFRTDKTCRTFYATLRT